MFPRNLTLFRFSPAVAKDLDERLEECLQFRRAHPVGPLELFSRGFVPPIHPNHPELAPEAGAGARHFMLRIEEKLLPAAVVNDALHAKVKQIAEEEGRKVGGRERKRIREDLLTVMLPKAFVRSRQVAGWVDTVHGWLVIDTASRKLAETVLTDLREALGSFPAVPLAPEEGPRVLLTDWLANGTLPAALALGDECELMDPATSTGAVARLRRQDLEAEEVREHLRNGKQVAALALALDGRLSLVLTEQLVVRKLKFMDLVLDQLEAANYQDAVDERTGTMTLAVLEVRRLLADLAAWFGLPRPADA